MNSIPPANSAAWNANASEESSGIPHETIAKPDPLDDLDLGDVKLGERQPEVCSMEEGCTVCQ